MYYLQIIISLQGIFVNCAIRILRYAVALLVEALGYKLEGRGFYSRLCLWEFIADLILGWTQPETEMSTKNIFLR
jgi:hypothetical protein